MKMMAMPGANNQQTCACSVWLGAMMEALDSSTRAYEGSPTRDKSGCGCEENAQARIDMLVLTQAAPAGKRKRQEHGCAELPKQ